MLNEAELLAFLLSLRVAVVATVVGLPIAILVAWVLARHDFRGKTVVDVLIHAPLVLPPVVVGYLLLVTFTPNGMIGRFMENTLGFGFAFTWQGAALAAFIMALPLMVRSIRLSFEAQDPKLELAARTLGAGGFKTFFRITLPLALPGVLTGSLLGFARALGEFGATITFVANIPGLTQTLPLALYSAIQAPGGEAAALRLMVLSLVIAFAALGFSEYLARRWKKKLEAVT